MDEKELRVYKRLARKLSVFAKTLSKSEKAALDNILVGPQAEVSGHAQTAGQVPGQVPGQLPGQFPGQYPGQIFALEPRTGDYTVTAGQTV